MSIQPTLPPPYSPLLTTPATTLITTNATATTPLPYNNNTAGSESGAAELALTQIRTDGGTQPRSRVDEFVVAEYALSLGEGVIFPPVVVFYDGDTYWLADGFHRYRAHQQLGQAVLKAHIKQGTRREAVLYSVGANATHGLRRTNEDKRRAVLTLLEDREWQRWSNREIASRCGVHHETVSRLRQQYQLFPKGAEEAAGGSGSDSSKWEKDAGQSADHPHPTLDLPDPTATLPLSGAMRQIEEETGATDQRPAEALELEGEPPAAPARQALSVSPGPCPSPGQPLPASASASSERLVQRGGTVYTMKVNNIGTGTGIGVNGGGEQRPTISTAPVSQGSEGNALLPFPRPTLVSLFDPDPLLNATATAEQGSEPAPALGLPNPILGQPHPLALLVDTPVADDPRSKRAILRLQPALQQAVAERLLNSPAPTGFKQALKEVRIEAATRQEQARIAALPPVGAGPGEYKPWTITDDQAVVAECALAVFDPPYGILDEEWEPRSLEELEAYTREWAVRWARGCRADHFAIFWSQLYFWQARPWFDESLAEGGYEYLQFNVWHYPNQAKHIKQNKFKHTFDPIFIYRHKDSQRPVNPSPTEWGQGLANFDCCVAALPQSMFSGAEQKRHPAQKPVAPYRWLISNLTEPGELVVDPFCGVAPSGVAAIGLGRRFAGIEINPQYREWAESRIAAYGYGYGAEYAGDTGQAGAGAGGVGETEPGGQTQQSSTSPGAAGDQHLHWDLA